MLLLSALGMFAGRGHPNPLFSALGRTMLSLNRSCFSVYVLPDLCKPCWLPTTASRPQNKVKGALHSIFQDIV